MGRKQKAPKLEATPHLPESSNPCLEMVTTQPKMHTDSVGLSSRKKASKTESVTVRRSGRLQNLVPSTQNQEIEPVTEEINLVESEKEDNPHVDQYTPESTLDETSLEEKIDFLFQIVEELKLKVTKRTLTCESSNIDLKYKSLYIDSQKKLEALADENSQLGKKLEIALGKLKMYESMKEVMEKFTKATDRVANLSSQTIVGRISSLNVVVELDAAVEHKTSTGKRKKGSK